MRRLVVEPARRDLPGGRGAYVRLMYAVFAALAVTMLCLQLPWYYVRLPDGIAVGRDNAQLPATLAALAVLAALAPRVVPARHFRIWQVVASCLCVATVCGFGVTRCLQVAGVHTTLHEPLGPAPWLGLIGFVASGTLALLAASALYQPARLNARQRKELIRAQERIDAALPAWPDR